MLHYESAKCLHGRMKLLKGKYYGSIFIHYTPVDKSLWGFTHDVRVKREGVNLLYDLFFFAITLFKTILAHEVTLCFYLFWYWELDGILMKHQSSSTSFKYHSLSFFFLLYLIHTCKPHIRSWLHPYHSSFFIRHRILVCIVIPIFHHDIILCYILLIVYPSWLSLTSHTHSVV